MSASSVTLTAKEWESVLTIIRWVEKDADEHLGAHKMMTNLRTKIEHQLDAQH